jgi:hypothetical protein
VGILRAKIPTSRPYGTLKHRESPFATHISPLTGLLAMLKPEPIDPAFQDLGVLKFSDKYYKVLKNKIL